MKSGGAARAASSSATAVGGLPRALYNNVWRKSNILYITYIVAGCVVIEVVYGSATNAIWEGRNKGVRFSHCCSLCRLPIHSLMHPPIHRPTPHHRSSTSTSTGPSSRGKMTRRTRSNCSSGRNSRHSFFLLSSFSSQLLIEPHTVPFCLSIYLPPPSTTTTTHYSFFFLASPSSGN